MAGPNLRTNHLTHEDCDSQQSENILESVRVHCRPCREATALAHHPIDRQIPMTHGVLFTPGCHPSRADLDH